MRKILTVFLLALFVVSMAWADTRPYNGPVRNGAAGATLPDMSSRTGTCQLGQFGTTYWGSFGWVDGYAYAQYLRPNLDDFIAGCSSPYYPYHVTSVDVVLDLDAAGFYAAEVGFTVTFDVSINFPQDLSPCKGVGPALVTAQGSYTLLQADVDSGGFVVVNVPLDVCVSADFFAVVTFVSWDGTPGWAPSPYSKLGGVSCNSWIKGLFCQNGSDWWCNSKDWTSGGNFVGPWSIYANGEAGASCDPVHSPTACARITGDTYANPIEVNWTHNSWIFDLCNFCPDYTMTTETGGAFGSNTSAGNDLVLHWVDADPASADFCFRVGIYPTENCDPCAIRLRSWLKSYDGSFLYLEGAGLNLTNAPNPIYTWPSGFGQPIGHNHSGNANPDDLGCMVYGQYEFWLVIDTRQDYCCPIRVRMLNDEVLPVEIMSFGAVAGDAQVTVSWTTAQESGIERYELMRNGEFLADVAGQGDSETGHHYSYVDNAVVNGETYSYQLVARGFDGSMLMGSTTVSATPTSAVVSEYALMQNYPNPFNPTTSISYNLKDAGLVTMKVYSVDGREVATLVNGNMTAGSHTVEFDASGLASGMYVYKMEVNGFSASQKMVLMK